MARVTRTPLVRHLRSQPVMHTLQYRKGQLIRQGRGLTFWFRPLSTGVAEIPVDDRDASFLFHARTADFQDLTVQGVLTYRVVDPQRLADHVDFTIDLSEGTWNRTPLEQVSALLTQLAQQAALDLLARLDLRSAVQRGIDLVRAAISEALPADERLAALGIGIAAVRVTTVQPTSDMEQALQTPIREAVQQEADEATFARRAMAVEKERAIAENELNNRIQLSRREQDLIGQQGANDRRRAEEEAAAARIEVEARTDRDRLESAARAEAIRQVGEAEAASEEARIAVYRDLPLPVLLGLAARELARKLERIDHLNLAPDAITGLLTNLLTAGTHRLENAPGER